LRGLNVRKELQETGLRRPQLDLRTGSTHVVLTQHA